MAAVDPERKVIGARIGGLAPSGTMAIDERAKRLAAEGHDVIGFGAGEPDFPTPPAIVAAAVKACQDPANHRYGPTAGLPELRAAIAAKTERDSGYHVEPRQVLVTNGGKQAVAEALATLLDPGDEVLIPAPYWTTYPEAVRLAGGVPVAVATGASDGYQCRVAELERAATSRTKCVIVCSPSNPTGAVFTREHLEAIGRFCVERGYSVLTDEIYEHLVYDEAVHHSLPVLVPELADRCVVVNGVAKTYAMTGWRVGWMIGPPDVVAAATNLQSQVTSNVAAVAQRAALAAVSGDLDAVHAMRAAFDRRRRRIHELLNAIDGVSCPLPSGAFYAFADLSLQLGREIAGRRPTTTSELAEVVLDAARVAFVPGEVFGAPGFGRFSYALADEALERGISRLGEVFATARPPS
jgi:aspartate aminotransferase